MFNSKRLLSYNLVLSFVTVPVLLIVASAFSLNVPGNQNKVESTFQDYAIGVTTQGLPEYAFDDIHINYTFTDGDTVNRGDSGSSKVVDDGTISATITADDVNFRNYPETYGDVLDCFRKGTTVKVTAKWNDWYKVENSAKSSGWVIGKYLTINTTSSQESIEKIIEKIPSEKPKDVVPFGQQVSNYAKNFLGVKYVWGGTSPKGFDCSGLVQYVYAQYGIYINRVAADQATQGTKVTRDNLKAGDLVFFDTNGGHSYISHVGMYIGNGNFIHASSGSSYKVIVSSLGESYYSNAFMIAKRYF